jgi:hypothetical protein
MRFLKQQFSRKNLTLFALSYFFLSPPFAHAQVQTTTNVVEFCLFCPNAQILVLNGTTDNSLALPEIDLKTGPVIGQGKMWGRNFSILTAGDVPITIRMCGATNTSDNFDAPPAWTADTVAFGDAAFTNPSILKDTSVKELDRRVKLLKKIAEQRLGGKAQARELDEWFKRVKADGIQNRITSCEEPIVIAAMSFNWGYYNSYGYGKKVTEVIIRGSRATGYQIEAPRYVYSSVL